MKMRLYFSTVLIVLISFKGKSRQTDVNIHDSISVNSFINRTSICQQIQAAYKFASDIAAEKGYGIKLLKALSKSTADRFNLPIATGGIVLTNS